MMRKTVLQASMVFCILLLSTVSFANSNLGVFRNGWWYLDSNGTEGWNAGDMSMQFGLSTDIPVTGDWDGNGTTDMGVFRNGWWYLDSNGTEGWNEGDTSVKFGLSTDMPVTGDWDGNGTTDIGVFRNGWWYLDSNGTRGWNEGDTSLKFGLSTDIPVAGDWNGNGTTDMGVFRNGWWYLDSNGTEGWNAGDTSVKFGLSTDIPVTGDWDGNGTTNIGVVRNGWWYLDSNGTEGWNAGDTSIKFGLSTDIPVTGSYVKGDRELIEDSLNRLLQALRDEDATAYMAEHDPSVTVLTSGNFYDDISSDITQLFSSLTLSNVSATYSIDVTTDTASVVFTWSASATSGSDTAWQSIKRQNELTYSKVNGSWKITSIGLEKGSNLKMDFEITAPSFQQTISSGSSPQFQWTNPSGIAFYRIYVWKFPEGIKIWQYRTTNSSTTSMVFNANGTATEDLQADTYYWVQVEGKCPCDLDLVEAYLDFKVVD